MKTPKKPAPAPGHHAVYVVYLENPSGDGKAGYYVGMTGLSPEERFQNHKNGVKAARVVRKHGVRLVPSADAEATVEGLGGMRHTSARRYSRDDPQAVVVVVSEDGPVTIFRDGDVVARSR